MGMLATAGKGPSFRRLILRWLLGGLAVAAAFLGAELARVTLGPNLHEVVPDSIYRSAQLDAITLRRAVEQHGIRTVINLRGCCVREPWYQEETRALRELGVRHFDINFSSYLTPSVPELQKLVEILSNAPRPVLLHCRRGADRTSLAAMAAVLLEGGATLSDAEGQLSLRYGHVPLGRVKAMKEVFDGYRDWLAGRGETHDPDLFRGWVRREYRPGHCWAEIVPLDVPKILPLSRPAAARVRVFNRSHLPWSFRQAAHVGVHLRCFLLHENGSYGVLSAAGFFDRQLLPGESLDLTVAIPALAHPGKYRLLIDMSDEQSCWFFMVGSPPYRAGVEVKDDAKLARSR